MVELEVIEEVGEVAAGTGGEGEARCWRAPGAEDRGGGEGVLFVGGAEGV